MYCRNCGKEVDEKAVICPGCGCIIDEDKFYQVKNDKKSESNNNSTLGTIAKIFMILGCVFSAFYFLIPLCWTIPMTVSLCNKLKNNEEISVGFKVCVLLFVNVIAGILLLCMKNEEKN